VTVTITQLLIWAIIAAIVGIAGELLAGRRGPRGFLGAALLGWLAIFLVVGVFHFHIVGEPIWQGVPVFSAIIAAVILAALYSAVFHRKAAA
jgi:uncharacterized membrane protein YeaQ/YmgE (transglycosylase-associated protein family)